MEEGQDRPGKKRCDKICRRDRASECQVSEQRRHRNFCTDRCKQEWNRAQGDQGHRTRFVDMNLNLMLFEPCVLLKQCVYFKIIKKYALTLIHISVLFGFYFL